MIFSRDLSTYSNTNVFCNSCINSNNGSYWCAFAAYTESGYCWESSESKSGCIGTGYGAFECSNEVLPSRAEYLLCPTDTSQCQSTSDFVITQTQQSRRINTGIVGPGRTCEYLITLFDPAINITYDRNTYDVTVEVEYVNSDTYLGVYKYTLSSNYVELLQEVGAGYTGSIQTTVDAYTEIYVQMHPNSSSSYAIFNVSSSIVSTTGNSTTSDDGLSGGAIAGIVIGILVFLIIVGVIVAYVIYVQYFQRKKTTPVSAFPSSSKTQDPVARNNDNIFFIDYNREVIQKPIYQPQTKNVAASRTQIQIPLDQEDTVNAGALSSEPRSNTFRESQSEQAPHNL